MYGVIADYIPLGLPLSLYNQRINFIIKTQKTAKTVESVVNTLKPNFVLTSRSGLF